jgi:hypothetical protein
VADEGLVLFPPAMNLLSFEKKKKKTQALPRNHVGAYFTTAELAMCPTGPKSALSRMLCQHQEFGALFFTFCAF